MEEPTPRNEEVFKAVRNILNELNYSSRKEAVEAIKQAIRIEHRTLQQLFWSAMLKAQIAYADSEFDLRNEAAVKLAKAVKETAIKNNMDMGLPII